MELFLKGPDLLAALLKKVGVWPKKSRTFSYGKIGEKYSLATDADELSLSQHLCYVGLPCSCITGKNEQLLQHTLSTIKPSTLNAHFKSLISMAKLCLSSHNPYVHKLGYSCTSLRACTTQTLPPVSSGAEQCGSGAVFSY